MSVVYFAIPLITLMFVVCFLLARVDAPLWDEWGDEE